MARVPFVGQCQPLTDCVRRDCDLLKLQDAASNVNIGSDVTLIKPFPLQ